MLIQIRKEFLDTAIEAAKLAGLALLPLTEVKP